MNDNIILRSSGALVFNSKNEILLMLRDDMPAWCIPGGDLDPGEDWLTGLTREIFEETGIANSAYPTPQFIMNIIHFSVEKQRVTREAHLYKVNIGDNQPILGDEGIEWRFFSIDCVPKNLFTIQDQMISVGMEKLIANDLGHDIQMNFYGSFKNLSDHPIPSWTGFDIWHNHPRVVAKRLAGTLRYDPTPTEN